MISYGFFNSVDNDRLYNAETFNKYFEGLIAENGIFQGVRGSFIVSAAGSGLAVNVASGKAIVNTCWAVNDAIETITLDAAHNLLPRYDKIGLLWDETNRNITLRKVTGTPASSPLKPAATRTTTQYEIVLAYVYVAPNATSLTAANITDTRLDTSLCGIITGLVEQVDIANIYNQYLTQFNELKSQLETWEQQQKNQMTAWETEQKAQYEAWYAALTEELNVNTYIEEQRVTYECDGTTTEFYLPIPEYDKGDILDVYLNNIWLIPNTDYQLMYGESSISPGELTAAIITFQNAPRAGNTITARWLKSKIGYKTT